MSAAGSTASGAASGAAAGTAIAPGIGTAIGAVVGGIGGYLSGSAKKKAEKERIKKLTQALRMLQAGSTDAFGNTLSADKTGRWKYNLSIPTQQAVKGANNILLSMGTYNPKMSSQIRNENLLSNIITNGEIARANQAAAMKQGLRSGSNLGYISNAYTKNRDKNIRNALLNAQKSAANPLTYNANVIAQLGQAAGVAMQPVNSIQTNLKDMVNTLNVQEMNQMNKIAGASANPYLHGQVEADLMKGLGTAVGDYAANAQQQQDNQQLLNLLEKMYTNNSNVVKKSTTNNKNTGNF
jgi:hypothetical protein